jgi:hypothetical protein
MRLLIVCTVALALVWGCSPISSYKEITRRSEINTGKEKPLLLVITTDGREIKLVDYALNDSALEGVGRAGPSLAQEFMGSIPLHDIDYIYRREGSFMKSVAFASLAGSAAVLLGESLSDRGWITTKQAITYPAYHSCPFVYAYDGSRYVFSTETFAGSIFNGAERTVIDRLDAVRPFNGAFTLKLTNERSETDYVNELSLIAVGHKAGVDVLASSDGVFHTIGTPHTPVACMDEHGKSLLDAVARADGLLWQTNRDHARGGEAATLIDRIEVQFAIADTTRVAKLLVLGKNTTLPVFAFDEMGSLCGDGYARWIYRLEHDPTQEAAMRGFLLREGLLHVTVWNGREWIAAGAFMDPGAELMREQLLVVRIPQGCGTTLRMRLTCTSDLWEIDRIALDDSRDVAVTCTPVYAIAARGSHSDESLTLLEEKDARYLISMPGDSLILTFPIPAAFERERQSMFVKSTGYYHHWSTFAGPDNSSEVQKILEIPGYGPGKYLPRWFAAHAAGGE